MPAHSPEDCDRQFADHVNAGDLEALMALYEPTCSLVQRDGQVATGHPEIRDVLGRLIAMRPTLAVEVVRTVRSGDDLAMLYSDWSLSATGPSGAPIEATGKAIEVVRRQPDGTWRFALDDPRARG